MGREEFRLIHYAGEVNYNVNGQLLNRGQRLKMKKQKESMSLNKSGHLCPQTFPSWALTDVIVYFPTSRLPGQEQWSPFQKPEGGEGTGPEKKNFYTHTQIQYIYTHTHTHIYMYIFKKSTPYLGWNLNYEMCFYFRSCVCLKIKSSLIVLTEKNSQTRNGQRRYLSICLSVCLSIWLFKYWSIFLSIYPSSYYPKSNLSSIIFFT